MYLDYHTSLTYVSNFWGAHNGPDCTEDFASKSTHKTYSQGASVGAEKHSSKPDKGQIPRDNGGRRTLISEPVKGISHSLYIVALLRSDSEPSN